MPPELLILGNIVKDISRDGWRAGGGVYYAGIQAQRLGIDTAIVTRCSDDVVLEGIVPGVAWHRVRDSVTTSFENTYDASGHRTQRLRAAAGAIDVDDVPEEWLQAPLILVASVFQDMQPSLVQRLAGRDGLLGVGVQGFLRRVEDGHVRPLAFEAEPEWLAGDVVFVSEQDVESDTETVQTWAGRVQLVLLTRGDRGCTMWQGDSRYDLPALPSSDVDPTGAGDVFAAALLIEYGRTREAVAAARFAAAAASLAVSAAGADGVGNREQIEAAMRVAGAAGR